jgi:hypothetical protein
MRQSAEDVTALNDRPHWSVARGRAIFAPVATGWRAVVRTLIEPTPTARFHIAVMDRTGTTRYAREAATLDDAVKGAERDVLARNALRLA